MNLRKFPMDEQACNMVFESCEYTNWFSYDTYLSSILLLLLMTVFYIFLYRDQSSPDFSTNLVRLLLADAKSYQGLYLFTELLFAQTSDLHVLRLTSSTTSASVTLD